jgi:hypothetical protein
VGTICGAYWDARDESVERIARRVAELLERLAGVDPLLSGWRDKAMTKKAALAEPVVTPESHDLVDRLQRGLLPGGPERPPGSGFSVYWWNGHSHREGGATLNVNNADPTLQRLPGALVLNVPTRADAPQLYTSPAAAAIIAAFIDTFQPERAVWLDDASRDAQTEPDQPQPNGGVLFGKLLGHPAGWATYLAASSPIRFDQKTLPTSASAERMSDGTLVLLGDDPGGASIADVLAVRTAMGYSVPDVTESPISAPHAAPLPIAGATANGAPVAEPRTRETPSAAEEQAQTSSTEQPRRGEV